MKRSLQQASAILALAVALSLALYFLRPDSIHWHTDEFELELSAAQQLDGALWVDARVDGDFQKAHLDGAILLNEENWEEGFLGLLEAWTPGAPIVVYCSSQACLRSHHVSERLREELGVMEIYSLVGGWEALLEAGLVKGAAL